MFSTRKFAPIAYLQAKTTDFPFDSWSIRCIAPEVGLLTVDTKRRIKIQIEIHPLYVKLIEMPQSELKHLVNKEMHPGILLMELSKCGIHLLPEDEDAARAGITLKDHEAEERAIMDIATTVKVFSFQSMKWGMQAPQDTVICRLRENPDNFREFYEEGEDDWESVMWWRNKCVFIDAKNSTDKFKGDIKKGQATQAMLPLAIKAIVESKMSPAITADAAERCTFVNDIDFMDNIQRTLRLLRLMSFT
jgi:cancer susceptibility candidate protein 1